MPCFSPANGLVLPQNLWNAIARCTDRGYLRNGGGVQLTDRQCHAMGPRVVLPGEVIGTLLSRKSVSYFQGGPVALSRCMQNPVAGFHGLAHDAAADGHSMVLTGITANSAMQFS